MVEKIGKYGILISDRQKNRKRDLI